MIAAPVAEVWRRTQDPSLHRRWDVRFTDIEYLPRAADAPQRFRYATRIAPGITVAGWGETVGERHRVDGTASSALRFGSPSRRSLIDEGAGFWRYVPTEGGTRFLTRFDYDVRWGRLGRLADRLFRPLFGWGTAWSFDRLRLWIEHGIPPERSRNRTLLHLTALTAATAALAVSGLPSPGHLDPLDGVIAAVVALHLATRRRLPAARRTLRSPSTKERTCRSTATHSAPTSIGSTHGCRSASATTAPPGSHTSAPA